MKSFLPIAAIVTMFSWTSCNPGKSDMADRPGNEAAAFNTQDARHFLDSVNTKFSEQVAAGDSVALAAHYWPDAELMLDNSETVKGSDITRAWGDAFRIGLKKMTFTTSDVKTSPSLIIETGSYEMKGDKDALIDRGKYVVVWEKRNNEWKLYRDIGCTSLPLTK